MLVGVYFTISPIIQSMTQCLMGGLMSVGDVLCNLPNQSINDSMSNGRADFCRMSVGDVLYNLPSQSINAYGDQNLT